MAARNHHSRSRHHRNDRHRPDHRHRYHHYLALGLLQLILCAPAVAEEGETNNVARPQAAATSNNTNQSVQINQQGQSSRQYFGNGVSCNGATLNVTPFYMGNDTIPYDHESYVRSNNWGIQFGVVVPLDGSISEMCKNLVKRQLERERLSYELTRASQCAKLLETGYTIRPDSDLSVLCSHVVSIEAWRRTQPDSSPVLLQSSSKPSSSPASKP